MSNQQLYSRPAWQTDELGDEWLGGEVVDTETSDDDEHGSSISLTEPLPTHIKTLDDEGSRRSPATSPRENGTFLVRQDVPHVRLLSRDPPWSRNAAKTFFSPLALERMFEPPSPPADLPLPVCAPARRAPSGSLQSHASPSSPPARIAQDHMGRGAQVPAHGSDGRSSEFTFRVPRATPPTLARLGGAPGYPLAQSTPGNALAGFRAGSHTPATDPRLRLFRFKYDTFTREHLSAIVDSIAVNTPSAGSRDDLRSIKRIKLSPESDIYGEGDGAWATITRPKPRKDYVGESRSLMQRIKQAPDLSAASSATHAPLPGSHDLAGPEEDVERKLSESVHRMMLPDARPGSGALRHSRSRSSSMDYRQQAAELMAQIKNDVHAEKRILSGDTEVCPSSQHEKSTSLRSLPVSATVSQQPRKETRDTHPSSTEVAPKPHTATPRPTVRKSPQRLLWRAGATDEHGLVKDMSRFSLQKPPAAPQGPTLVPHISVSPFSPPNETGAARRSAFVPPSDDAYLLNAQRPVPREDINRFVSSSTASGTTLTAGSARSFANQAGPSHMRRIAPEDVPALPERVGKMVFDKATMKWVKSTANSTIAPENQRQRPAGAEASAESEDPFKDIESLHDSKDKPLDHQQQQHDYDSGSAMDIEEEEPPSEREEELESFDQTSGIVQEVPIKSNGIGDIFDDQTIKMNSVYLPNVQHPPETDNTKRQPRFSRLSIPSDGAGGGMSKSGTPMRSALKSATATPSALKDPSKVKDQTPLNRRVPRRSVSFSDGKREGPIRGIGRDTKHSSSEHSNDSDHSSDADEIDSPLKASSSSRPSSDEIQPLSARMPMPKGGSTMGDMRLISRPTSRASMTGVGNATFLTECSFGVAHDRLVQVITDVQPYNPHWEELTCIDLTGKNIDSVARLKEFLPRLDELNLNSNQLSWLSGVPSTVRTLSIAMNNLTGLTSFGHLHNIERLDIRNNDIESLHQLECLRHLQELRADGNNITSLGGLETMRSLEKLSVQGNRVQELHLGDFQWAKLQMLNLSLNRLGRVSGLEGLISLISLNLDNNCLEEITAMASMPKLRMLRVSGNRLRQLDVAPFQGLRTLYADNNLMTVVATPGRVTRMENLSLRHQSGRGFNLSSRDIRDVKRLYLSGNPLKNGFLSEPCYNLVYMELAACRLTSLPAELAQLVPNLRALNLNYNFLEDAAGLEGLERLNKLTIIGSRLKSAKPLIRLLQGFPELEMLDLRMNPCTLGWYLPLLVKDVPGSLLQGDASPTGVASSSGMSNIGSSGSCGVGGGNTNQYQHNNKGQGGGAHNQHHSHHTHHHTDWQELDAKFRRDLPDEAYLGRLAYRGLVMRACPRIKKLDGVEVTEREKTKAMQVLGGMAKRRQQRELGE